jgi:transketolase C-terminal domain/subunit
MEDILFESSFSAIKFLNSLVNRTKNTIHTTYSIKKSQFIRLRRKVGYQFGQKEKDFSVQKGYIFKQGPSTDAS